MGNVRDQNGRFGKGNPGGPGRPHRAFEQEYLAALSEVTTPAQWRKVCARAVKDAVNGDASARNWLSKYLLGEQPAALPENQPSSIPQGIISNLSIDELKVLSTLRRRVLEAQREAVDERSALSIR